MNSDHLREYDPEIYEALLGEMQREDEKLLLIASENYVSPAVLEAQGSLLTNKYAEGYPAKRYYFGTEYADQVESAAIRRAKDLFHADHVNVQPHSGTQANMAVYFSCMKPGDTILGMKLAHGGHLSHGSPVNFTGLFFKTASYGVDRNTGLIDMGEVRALALEHRPKIIVVGASAYSRIIDFQAFAETARENGAWLLADIAHIAGLVAAGEHPSPIPYADYVTTTTHKTLRGPRGGMIMCRAEHAKAIDKAVFPGIQGGPLMHVIAAKAVAFKEAMSEDFRHYQRNVVRNAKKLAYGLTERGFTIVSGGTDTHMMLVDLSPMRVTGKEAGEALDRAGVTVNKNAIPYDDKPPTITSGIRIGTPCVTTRGMGEPEMDEIADIITAVIKHIDDSAVVEAQKERVRALCGKFPIYPNISPA